MFDSILSNTDCSFAPVDSVTESELLLFKDVEILSGITFYSLIVVVATATGSWVLAIG